MGLPISSRLSISVNVNLGKVDILMVTKVIISPLYIHVVTIATLTTHESI